MLKQKNKRRNINKRPSYILGSAIIVTYVIFIGVPPNKVDNIEQLCEPMTQFMWEFLHERYVWQWLIILPNLSSDVDFSKPLEVQLETRTDHKPLFFYEKKPENMNLNYIYLKNRCFKRWMDDLRFYVLFNSISVISG